ncbi:MAG: hypothetical protein R3Y50_11010 [Rikenellaceae bacterium]
MKQIEALTLNTALSELKITGEGVEHKVRSTLIKNKIKLSDILKKFEEYKVEAAKECGEDKKLFIEIVEEYLNKEVEISLETISEEQLNLILDRSELKTAAVEILFINLIS